MGAWGLGNYENDDALDWSYDLESSGLTAIEKALVEVFEQKDYLDAPYGSMALAAIDVLTCLRGRPLPNRLAEPIGLWVTAHQQDHIADSLIEKARKALPIILNEKTSELCQCWSETDDYEEWKTIVSELEKWLA